MTDLKEKIAASAARRTRRALHVQANADLNAVLSASGAGRALAKAVGVKLKKVPKAKLRKRLIKALDKAFSLAVRAKCSVCTFCGGPVQHAFHFVTRAKYSVRWDYRNATGSCAGCNYRYEFDPHFAISYYISFHGLPAYEQLIRDGNVLSDHSNDDLQKRLDEIGRAG